MVRAASHIDVTTRPELLKLAEHVHETGEACSLEREGEALAVVVPNTRATPRRRPRAKTQDDWDAFEQAFGSWKDVDTDKLIEDIYESRRHSMKPPVEL